MTETPSAAEEAKGREEDSDTWFPVGTKHRGPMIVAFAVTVVVAAVVTILLRTVFAVPVLDQEALQTGVRHVLTEDFQLRHVSRVRCPAEQPIEQGHRFTCEVTQSGIDRRVTITVTNDTGEYRVDLPEE